LHGHHLGLADGAGMTAGNGVVALVRSFRWDRGSGRKFICCQRRHANASVVARARPAHYPKANGQRGLAVSP